MSHPPIPRDCRYFVDDRFAEWSGVPLEKLSFYTRGLVAAVAEVAWRKEAEKWATTPVNDCKNFDDIAAWKTEAEQNARAWREWGEQK